MNVKPYWITSPKERHLRIHYTPRVTQQEEGKMDALNEQFLNQVRQELPEPVGRLLEHADAEVAGWSIEKLQGGAGEGLGVFRVSGQARLSGRVQEWTLILKILAATGTSDPASWNYASREALVYQSDILSDLPDGLRVPRYLGGRAQPDGTTWLWLESINMVQPEQWTVEQLAYVARLMGIFSGQYLAGRPLPGQPWLSRSWLRGWTEASNSSVAYLRTVRGHVWLDRLCPPALLQQLLAIWDARNAVYDTLETLPQTLCHQDVFYRNLFWEQQRGKAVVTLLDWAFVGQAAVGEELVPLVLANVHFFGLPIAELASLEQHVLEAYVTGLEDAGWRGDWQLVWRGYALAAALRYTLAPARMWILTDDGIAQLEQMIGRQYPEIFDCLHQIFRHCLNLWARYSPR